ncbi:hypothetical protein CBR_g10819 [Chara braunii]|uniref:Uncharacterized protein n=1 Tax=Chara braunii TaxID=69332 RepID=A0A388KPL4_CHABU|nr:hypothetical protein CBR_g10819 [Chara braunii]|eukprot:GBG71883.1 hypothetical protein CBR_g10819 [Chara braunii]
MKGIHANNAIKAVVILVVFLAFFLFRSQRLPDAVSTNSTEYPAPITSAVNSVATTATEDTKPAPVVEQKAAVPLHTAGCPLVYNEPGHFTASQIGRVRAVEPQGGSSRCQAELISYLIRTVNVAPEEQPQLAFDQMLWIGVTVSTSAMMVSSLPSCSEGDGVCAHNFLVWGMGRDSHVWMNANCLPDAATAGGKIRTRTVFLENSETWVKMVREKLPTMEGYLVEYHARLSEAYKFFDNPYVMEVPANMKNTCFNVVLVDGPPGFLNEHPGRMEASYWSLSMAKRCLMEKKLDVVHIFLHDVQRPLESAIMAKFFSPNSQFLGFIAGFYGELAGFRLTRSTLQA